MQKNRQKRDKKKRALNTPLTWFCKQFIIMIQFYKWLQIKAYGLIEISKALNFINL